MKLIRFGEKGDERPGIELPEGQRIDVSAFGEDYTTSFFENNGPGRLADWLISHQAHCPLVMEGVRLGPPIKKPGKIVCIGLNYVDHARETAMKTPAEPIVFLKATSALCGPDDNLVIPRDSQKTDWEVELAIVIGQKASYVEERAAYDHVAGYVLHNDYSERAYQTEMGGQWTKGKGCDTFAPLGPFIATKDEITNVNKLNMWLKVNGVTKQNSSTANFIFDVPYIISYLSRFMTLEAGDVVSTGTPAGVGMGAKPPQYLKPGDVVELGIDRLGSSSQKCVEWQAES